MNGKQNWKKAYDNKKNMLREEGGETSHEHNTSQASDDLIEKVNKLIEVSLKIIEDNDIIKKQNSKIIEDNKIIIKQNSEVIEDNKIIIKLNSEVIEVNEKIKKLNSEVIEDNNQLKENNKQLLNRIKIVEQRINKLELLITRNNINVNLLANLDSLKTL